jgi:hypothetical protein
LSIGALLMGAVVEGFEDRGFVVDVALTMGALLLGL